MDANPAVNPAVSLRNVAIIAHVDHGKTTLVDCLLKQSGTSPAHRQLAERAMDSNDLERERGITILAKCTSVVWNETRINIVDTPGHADFGGEVERILSMVDSCLLLVDAAEGPMPQTKFVLGKSLKLGLRPIVVINKVDRPDQRADEVLNEVFDLFVALDANEHQLDFPVLYASAKQGWASPSHDQAGDSMTPLFDLILEHAPSPQAEPDEPFRMLVTILESDPFLGRILTGRIEAGRVQANQSIKALSRTGKLLEQGRVSKVLAFRGLERTAVTVGEAGDIVAIAGMTKATVADTLADPVVDEPIIAAPIDPSTIAMTFSVNDSPYAGTDGDKVTSRVIWDRLQREAEGNVAIRVSQSQDKDSFEVAGRGELQLSVLIETMRREGFELSISRPRVLFRDDPETGSRQEPIEEVTIDVDEDHTGVVVEKLTQRKSDLVEMRPSGVGRQRLIFHAPTRALIGYLSELLTDTRGTAIMNRVFHHYARHKGPLAGRHTGVIVSQEQGEAVAYALWNLEDRGVLFVAPGEKVYSGMVIGEHSRFNDLEVNPLKAKKLTYIRSAGKDDNVMLTPPLRMSLEQALTYIADDELVEVTPHSIRLRKRYLDANLRKKAARQKEPA